MQFNPDDRVLVGNTPGEQWPARFIAMDSGEYPYIAHPDTHDRALAFKYCLLDKREEPPQLAVDTPVWVGGRGGLAETPQHFAMWHHGSMYCWEEGKTSHTACAVRSWDCWSLQKTE